MGFQFVEKGSTEGITQIIVIEVIYFAPETVITIAAFRDKTVYMGIPFKITSESVEDHDEAGSEVFGFVHFVEQTRNNTGDRVEETVEQGTVFQEIRAQVLIDGKNTVPVNNVDELEGHIGCPFHGILISTGGTEAAMAAERDKFHFPASGASIHSSTESGIATIDHLFHVLNYRRTWMKNIYHFFVMVCKDSLKDIHKDIIEEMEEKRKPHPSRLRGRGS